MTRSESFPRILIVGTGHWANHGRDIVNRQFDDFLSARRQDEIREVLGHLLRFDPTAVVVEYPFERNELLNADYREFRAGKFPLTASEIHQLGFRLADALGHGEIFGVDWNEGTIRLSDVLNYAQQHQPNLHALAMRSGAPAIVEETVVQQLRWLNRIEGLQSLHRPYPLVALMGDPESEDGSEWVANWYRRNLRIFSRICHVALRGHERVLVIYGAAHAYLLTQFVRECDGIDLVDPIAALADS